MSANKDPMAQFGRKIAASVTRDPAFEAMFTQGRVIPSTWGNIASQLFEQGIIEPDPLTAAEFLGIERQELSDPTLRFTNPYELQEFENGFMMRKEAEYKAAHIAGARKFGEYMKDEVEARSTQPDPIRMQEIEEEFRALENRKAATRQDHQVISTRKGILRLQYMAVKSGLAIPLPEFVATALGYGEEDGFTVAERAYALSVVIEDEVMAKNLFLNPGGVSATDVLVGHDLHRIFASTLGHVINKNAYSYAEGQWARIEHIFIAPHHSRHPLFAGNEE